MNKEIINAIITNSNDILLYQPEKYDKVIEIRDFINQQQQEIDRLNNIIDELEKWLNSFETKEFNYNFLVVRVKDIQDKLKELRGDNNESNWFN